MKPMMANIFNLLKRLMLITLIMGGLSACMYDRYLQQSDTRSSPYPTRSNAATTAAAAPIVQVNSASYYEGLSYRHVTVRAGDTLSVIATRNNVPVQAVIALNNSAPPYRIYSGQLVKIPEFIQHRVVGGETLYAISRVYEVEMGEIVHFNFLEAPYLLAAGKVLNIPQSTRQQTRVAAVGPAAWTVSGNNQDRKVDSPNGTAPLDAVSSAPQVSSKTLSAPQVASKPLAIPASPSVKTVEKAPEPQKPVQVASIAPSVVSDVAPSTAVVGQEIPAEAMPPLPRHRYSTKSLPSRAGRKFSWPATGPIISSFGKKDTGFHNDGINIKLTPGTPVRAAENGVVSYVGNEMRSFGNLILISHADGYVTTYGHVATMSVYKGQAVQKGDIIGTSGTTGDVSIPQLHFEIRKNGSAKNPKLMLASR